MSEELKLTVEAYVSLDEAHDDNAFLWADEWPHDTPPACVWQDTGTGTTGMPGHLETTKANADRLAACWNAMSGITDPAAFVQAARGCVEALEAILHAVCHDTGFAAAVRADSGVAYPWEALDISEEQSRAALTAFRAATGEKM